MSDGFTAVYCGTAGCPHTRAPDPAAYSIVEALQAIVRSRPHAVLVCAPCITPGFCGQSSTASGVGALVLVQPCDVDRRPDGPAVLAGPLHERSDLEELCSWLADGPSVSIPLHLDATAPVWSEL